MPEITMEISDSTLEQLEALAIDCGAKDVEDLTNHAINLLEFLINHQKSGGQVFISVDEKGGRERTAFSYLSLMKRKSFEDKK